MIDPAPALTRNAFRLLVLTLVMHALAAYAIGSIPFPWFGQIASLYLFVWLGFRSTYRTSPGMVVFSFFLIYAFLVTSVQSALGDYYNYMPPKATTPYLFFIALRFMNLVSFGSLIFIAFWFLSRGWKPQIMKLMTILCLVFSLAAIYIYIAQIYGLPEPPRTRLGTGGGEQSVKFTYAFHRALGTFREPSHLAEWLVLPLFMSFGYSGWLGWLARTAGVTALFLTGSLTGIGAVIGGMAAGFVFLIPFMSIAVVKNVARMVLVGAIGLGGFSLMVSSKTTKGADLIGVLTNRVKPIEEKGIGQSNRNYVYAYLDGKEISWFGEGLGNANLRFTQEAGLDATASFLNLFINIAFSLGYLGLSTFIIFLLIPFVMLFSNRRYKFEPDHFLILSAFFAWLVVFFVHSEELSFHFAVIYALLIHAVLQQRPVFHGEAG